MLTVTTYISTDIAAVPLLWVVPLGLYLLTFAIAFAGGSGGRLGSLMALALPVLVIPPIVTLLIRSSLSPVLIIPLHLAAFFVAAMVCHGELVRARPSPARLTEFYLWISIGGVAGGIAGAIVSPLVFPTPIEYPIALVLACLCRPTPACGRWKARVLDYGAPAAVAAVIVVQVIVARQAGLPPRAPMTYALFLLPAMLTCATVWHRPGPYAAGLAIVLIAGHAWAGAHARFERVERNFFGVLRVERSVDGRYRALVHGNTIHGTQAVHPEARRQPTTYFARSGPAGQVIEAHAGPAARVAVVGLGAGTLAAYATGAQAWTFYEIDPAVERLARDPRAFTYLSDCGSRCQVVAGDARLTLARAGDAAYDLIVLDAFSSDAIPVHLLTREAFDLYQRTLAPGGLLLFHLSNRFLDLNPVLAAAAASHGLEVRGRADLVRTYEEAAAGKFDSVWAVMARSTADLGQIAFDPRWTRLALDPGVRPWTDDYSNVVSLLRVRSQ
jgi:SAM-dependent methyltransferase